MSMTGLSLLGDIFQQAAPADADTNIFSTSLAPKYSGTLRLQIVLSTTSIVSIVRIKTGETDAVSEINNGNAIVADRDIALIVSCVNDQTYNFRLTTPGANPIRVFQVDAVYGGVL